MKLSDLNIGDRFTYFDTGFGGTGRVDEYYGVVIGHTTENLVAIKYGKTITNEDGNLLFHDKEMNRVALWDSRLIVKPVQT